MKKTIAMFLLIVALCTSSVKAIDLDISNRTRTGCYPTYLSYKGRTESLFDMYYNYNGTKVPLYCLFHYITDEEMSKYDEVMSGALNNVKIWRVLRNGFPNKSIQELGCQKESEAYVATGFAILSVAYDYDLNDLTITEDEGADRVLNALKNILEAVKNSKDSLPQKTVKVEERDTWKKEDNYMVKKYFVNDSQRQISNVTLEKGIDEGIKIVDENNVEKNVFDTKECFKVKIPLDKVSDKIQFKINVETSFKNQPIIYGKTAYSGWKGINLQVITYENGKAEYEETYEKTRRKSRGK